MESKRVFVAGATGAIGIVLCRLLVSQGYEVFGMTRKPEKAQFLTSLGILPVVCDVYDIDNLVNHLKEINPEVVFHQLTDLPYGLVAEQMEQGLIKNARIREVGTRNLVEAIKQTQAKKIIAQSICFMYAPGTKPFLETQRLSSESLNQFEQQILNAPVEGVVLRYGRLYGPGTGFDFLTEPAPLHVDAAAHGAYLAMEHGRHGIYNFAEDDGEVSSEKAKSELHWKSAYREMGTNS